MDEALGNFRWDVYLRIGEWKILYLGWLWVGRIAWKVKSLKFSGMQDGLQPPIVWWFILCVYLTWPRDLVRRYLWVCLWGHFWKRLASESVDSVEQIALLSVGRYHPVLWVPEQNQTTERGECAFFDCLTWKSVSSCHQTGVGLTLLVPLVLRPSDSDGSTPLAFLHLHLPEGKYWDFSAYISHKPIPYNKEITYRLHVNINI